MYFIFVQTRKEIVASDNRSEEKIWRPAKAIVVIEVGVCELTVVATSGRLSKFFARLMS